MVKTYVLVDEETYERKFDPQRTRASAEGERKAAVAPLPNPFQNPDARRAKQVQREMYKVGQDKSLDVDTSVRLFRRLMDEYESRISRVNGKRNCQHQRWHETVKECQRNRLRARRKRLR